MNKNNTPRIRRTVASFAVVGAVALGLSACGSDDADDESDDTEQTEEASGDVSIADPWSREPADGQSSSAVYGVVTNGTDETITAVSATASVSDTVELHEVVMNDEGQMTMREKDGGYEIAPGDSLTFEPGGPHIMLLDIDPATYPDAVDVTLTFDNGNAIAFRAEVRALDGDAMGDMDMDDMDGMDHNDGETEEMDMDGMEMEDDG